MQKPSDKHARIFLKMTVVKTNHISQVKPVGWSKYTEVTHENIIFCCNCLDRALSLRGVDNPISGPRCTTGVEMNLLQVVVRDDHSYFASGWKLQP